MTWGYRPDLDGLRTIAVYLVVLHHAGLAAFEGGFIGVDLFFVLSGFLVSNVLLAEADRDGTFRLGRFYAARVRRLLPAAVVAILATCLVFVLVASAAERLPLVRDAQAALLYLANWQFIAASNDYFAADTDRSPFLHFWSLSIEEQFYVFYPLLLLALLRLGRGRRKPLLVALGVLAVASVAAQVVWAQIDANRAYYGTDTRLYQLLAGALLAVALRTPGRRVAAPAGWAVVAGLGVVALLVLGSGLVDLSPSTRGIAAALASVAAIGGTYRSPDALLTRALARPTPVFLGKISYGTYLWHWPVILVIGELLEVRPLVMAVVAGVVSTGLAALSYQMFELPIRRSSRLTPYRWRAVGAGLAVSAVAAALIVGPVLRADRAPVVRAAEVGGAATTGVVPGTALARLLDRPVPDGLDWEAIDEDRGVGFQWCAPDRPQDCVAVDGDGPHVVVVGDSQARMFTPAFIALAKEHGFRLSFNISPACPWQDGLANTGQSAGTQEDCRESRADFYDRTLPAMEPDLVILMARPRDDDTWHGYIRGPDGGAAQLPEVYLESTRRTVELIRSAGARTVIVKSVLGTDGYAEDGWDPLDCLARARVLGDCAVRGDRERPVSDGYFDAIAAMEEDVAVIDLNPLICPGELICPPLAGGHVVWRHPTHVTGSYARSLRDGVWELLQATGLWP